MLLVVDKFDGGLYSDYTISKIVGSPSDSPCCHNVEFFPRGTVRRRVGYSVVGTAASAMTGTIIGRIVGWTDNQDTPYSMAFTYPSGTIGGTGEVFSIEGAVPILSRVLCAGTSGVTAWNPTSGSNFLLATSEGSAVWIDGGNHAPWTWNGNSSETAKYLSGAPSAAHSIAAWYGYLFLGDVLVGSTRHSSMLTWNTPGDLYSWPATYYLELDNDDGDSITVMTMLRDTLVVFKRRKIFNVSWVGGLQLFEQVRTSSQIGCVASKGVVEVRGKLYFLGYDGLYSYDGANTEYLAAKVRDKFLNFGNAAVIERAEVVYYPDHDQIWVSLTSSTSTYRDVMMVYDLSMNNWTVYTLGAEAVGTVTWANNLIYADFPLPYVPDYDSDEFIIGNLGGAKRTALLLAPAGYWLYQYGISVNDNGTAFNSIWRSGWLDFGTPIESKRILRTTLFLDRQSNTTSGASGYFTIYQNLIEPDTEAGTAYAVSMCGSTDLVERRVDFTKYLRAFQFDYQADSPWTLHRVVIDYVPKGRTLVGG